MDPTQKDQWFRETVRTYEPRLLRFLVRLVPLAVAREIAQETFLKLFHQEDDAVAKHTAQWLFTVSRNAAHDFLKKERFTDDAPPNPATLVDPTPLALETLEARQELERVLESIRRLPENQQEVVRLKFQEGFSYNEISAITGHSTSYIGVLIYQAVQKIRKDLSNSQGENNETGT